MTDPQPRFVVHFLGYGDKRFVVWDNALNRQHDPVPYMTQEHAQEHADLANQVNLGNLGHLRDPHWVKD